MSIIRRTRIDVPPTSAASRPGRLRRLACSLLLVPALAGALLLGGASSASAVETRTLAPNTFTFLPTWFWTATELCVTSLEGFTGRVRVNVPTGAGEYINTAPGATTCVYRQWWGAPIQVNNVGAGAVRVVTR